MHAKHVPQAELSAGTCIWEAMPAQERPKGIGESAPSP
jgi:hypothetical protein